jgi:hypothetical protein
MIIRFLNRIQFCWISETGGNRVVWITDEEAFTLLEHTLEIMTKSAPVLYLGNRLTPPNRLSFHVGEATNAVYSITGEYRTMFPLAIATVQCTTLSYETTWRG